MKTILICHHDPSYVALLGDYLREKGYQVFTMIDPSQVVAKAHTNSIDLCILDAMLSDDQASQLTRQLIGIYHRLPIMVVSPIMSREEQLYAYRNGASDYVVMPTDMELLVARMEALIRLTEKDDKSDMPTSFTFDNIEFDGVRHRLGNKELSARESDLLLLLIQNKGQLVLRSYILQTLWGTDDIYASRSLAVFINRIRKYLALCPNIHILSVRGKGYKLIDEKQ